MSTTAPQVRRESAPLVTKTMRLLLLIATTSISSIVVEAQNPCGGYRTAESCLAKSGCNACNGAFFFCINEVPTNFQGVTCQGPGITGGNGNENPAVDPASGTTGNAGDVNTNVDTDPGTTSGGNNMDDGDATDVTTGGGNNPSVGGGNSGGVNPDAPVDFTNVPGNQVRSYRTDRSVDIKSCAGGIPGDISTCCIVPTDWSATDCIEPQLGNPTTNVCAPAGLTSCPAGKLYGCLHDTCSIKCGTTCAAISIATPASLPDTANFDGGNQFFDVPDPTGSNGDEVVDNTTGDGFDVVFEPDGDMDDTTGGDTTDVDSMPVLPTMSPTPAVPPTDNGEAIPNVGVDGTTDSEVVGVEENEELVTEIVSGPPNQILDNGGAKNVVINIVREGETSPPRPTNTGGGGNPFANAGDEGDEGEEAKGGGGGMDKKDMGDMRSRQRQRLLRAGIQYRYQGYD